MKKLVLSSMALTMLAGHAHAQSSVTLSGTIYGGLGLNSGGVKSNTTAAGTSPCGFRPGASSTTTRYSTSPACAKSRRCTKANSG